MPRLDAGQQRAREPEQHRCQNPDHTNHRPLVSIRRVVEKGSLAQSLVSIGIVHRPWQMLRPPKRLTDPVGAAEVRVTASLATCDADRSVLGWYGKTHGGISQCLQA